jgi:DNA-binding CsgD family transcriptional regulator
MVGREREMRRVTVVTHGEEANGSSFFRSAVLPANAASERERCTQLQRLQDALGEIVALVGLGSYRTDEEEGVLLDVVVDDIRCLFLEHEPTRLISLSPREQQIARMVAAGRTNQAIASSLEISVWTVSTHLRRTFAKLAVSNRTEMVAHLLANPDLAHRV